MRKFINYLFLFFFVGGAFSNVIAPSNAADIPSPKDKKPAEIGVIIGSTRPNRIGKQIAEWILNEVCNTPGLKFRLVDLVDFSLPLLNEPFPAAQSDNYTHEHTKKWSKEVQSYQGYVFIIPEYNSGYPASIKNAIDYLFKEWNGKAALIISYGFQGGKKSAEQFNQILTAVKLHPTQTMPALTLKKEMFDEKGQIKSPGQDFAQYMHGIKKAVQELRGLILG